VTEDTRPLGVPDPSDAITTAENTLRELIEVTLGTRSDWLSTSALTPDRIERMVNRLAEERRRRQAGVPDERPL
jgi:predicted Zn-dependent peptidase